MATVGQIGNLVPLSLNTTNKAQTVTAGGPEAPTNDVTPTPLGDINNLPRDGQPSTLPLGNTPTAPTTPSNSTPPTGGGGTIDEQHRGWSSIGDPHITMGNEKFDNTRVGEFVLMESQDKSFQVQARQDKFADGSVANTAAAVKDGDNVVSYDVKDKKLMVNGQEWDGQTQPAGGMKIEKTGDGFAVTSSKGDVTNIKDKGHYLDLEGKVGPERQVGEVKGAHGVFDNVDTDESHIKRDGTKAATNDDMIDSWKVGEGESLFNKAQAGGPAAAGDGAAPKPLDPNAPANDPAAQQPGAQKPADPAAPGAGGPQPADPAKPADPAAPAADGKGGPGATDDITKALQDILTQLKDLITNLTKIMEKMGIKVDAPAAGGPAAAPADPKAAAAAAPAADGKGGPAAAPATFADQKKADGADAGATKTFAEQRKEDDAKAAAAAAGKGGPADAKAAEAKPADAKAAEAKPADAKAAEVKAGGPEAAADPIQDILKQLQDLIKGLTALIEKLGAAQGAAPQAAAAQPAPIAAAQPAAAQAKAA